MWRAGPLTEPRNHESREREELMLELRDLVKHYPSLVGEPVRAVDGVSLTVRAGEMVALYGPSGSGKTTLLLMIAILLAPTSGTVLIGGRDTCTLSEREASRFRLTELGFIRQSFDLLPGVSAIDNAVLKLLGAMRWRQARREIEPLLVRLGLGERLHHRSETLSMGERQRVMIARALSTGPRLLLADEPTGSLDTQRGREVLELLRELCRERGVAVVLVSHDPMAARYADRVLVLRDGRLGDYDADPGTGGEADGLSEGSVPVRDGVTAAAFTGARTAGRSGGPPASAARP
jgi:putative ABC transport system ATP-binding protein